MDDLKYALKLIQDELLEIERSREEESLKYLELKKVKYSLLILLKKYYN